VFSCYPHRLRKAALTVLVKTLSLCAAVEGWLAGDYVVTLITCKPIYKPT
jgi:hypothetical protein